MVRRCLTFWKILSSKRYHFTFGSEIDSSSIPLQSQSTDIFVLDVSGYRDIGAQLRLQLKQAVNSFS